MNGVFILFLICTLVVQMFFANFAENIVDLGETVRNNNQVAITSISSFGTLGMIIYQVYFHTPVKNDQITDFSLALVTVGLQIIASLMIVLLVSRARKVIAKFLAASRPPVKSAV